MRAFYEYHAALVEPWDGPAALLASDGAAGRGHARPQRPAPAALRADPRRAGGDRVRGRRARASTAPTSSSPDALRPGQMLVVDPGRGPHPAATARSSCSWRGAGPTGTGWPRTGCASRTLRRRGRGADRRADGSRRLQRAFGYTEEELAIVAAMARDGAEPVGSMGDDTPPAVLSRPAAAAVRLLPPALRPGHEPADRPPARGAGDDACAPPIGAIGNLLDERPHDCRRVDVSAARCWTGEQLRQLRALPATVWCGTLPTLYDPAAGADALERAMDELLPGGLAARCGRGDDRHPVRPRRRRGARRDPGAAGGRRRPLAPGPRGRARHVRPGRRVGRAARDDARRPAARLRGGRRATRTWRSAAALDAERAGDAEDERSAVGLEGPAQDLLQDGHLHGPELPRRPHLRGGRPRPARWSSATSRAPSRGSAASRLDDVSRDGRSAARARRSRDGARSSTHGGEYRLRPGGERHAWDRGRRRPPAARRPRRQRRQLRGVRRRRSTRPAAHRHCRAACSSFAPVGPPMPLDAGRAVGRDRAAVRHRRDEPGLDLARRRTRRWPWP